MNSLESVVDDLQYEQLCILGEPNVDLKIAKMREAIELFKFGNYIGQTYWVKANDIFGESDEKDDGTLTRIMNTISFGGRLIVPSYIHDNSLPIDSLVLRFLRPNPLCLTDHSGVALYDKLTVGVPILSVMNIVEWGE